MLGAFYRDDRTGPVKVDNRPLTARQADTAPIELTTLAGHVLIADAIGSITVDGLGWRALQTGSWGVLDHRAYAFAVEAGIQMPTSGKPWLRAGWNQTKVMARPAMGATKPFSPCCPRRARTRASRSTQT